MFLAHLAKLIVHLDVNVDIKGSGGLLESFIHCLFHILRRARVGDAQGPEDLVPPGFRPVETVGLKRERLSRMPRMMGHQGAGKVCTEM